MKQIMKFKCEKCGAMFESQEDCQKCETSHVMPKKMVSLSFNWADTMNVSKDLRESVANDLDSTYPQMIKIQMEDGKVIEYKPVHLKRKLEVALEKSFKETSDMFNGVFKMR